MAATQQTLDGESTLGDQGSDDTNILFEQTVDVLGCPVDGCNFSGPSIHSLYSHCNGVHHGADGSEGTKQQMLVQYFSQFSKADREQSVALTAQY